jgi:tRNA nucleotidyltransferase/poly(A) polymerase
MWNMIPDSVKYLQRIFKNNGKKLYLVGGSVRDFINGEKPKDFDLATDANPDEILDIIGDEFKTSQQGKAFGVVVVYPEDQPKGIEIATFREDIYGEKLGLTRNPDVTFSTIDKDVERRDITYNALFYDLESKKIIDLVGGIQDLKNKKTRFVGNPDMRIKEDPLRILRLIRFNCRYGFDIDKSSFDAIRRNKNELCNITKERIWSMSGDVLGEIVKSYQQAKDFKQYLELLDEFDLWFCLFQGLKINTNIAECNHLVLYIANLLVDNDPKNLLTHMTQKLKIEYDFSKKVAFLISLMKLNFENVLELYKKKSISGVEREMIEEWYMMKGLTEAMFQVFLDFEPTVSANDLMQAGFKDAELGREIKRLETLRFKELCESN